MFYFIGVVNGGMMNGTFVGAEVKNDARVQCWRRVGGEALGIGVQLLDYFTNNDPDAEANIKATLEGLGHSIIEVVEPVPA